MDTNLNFVSEKTIYIWKQRVNKQDKSCYRDSMS